MYEDIGFYRKDNRPSFPATATIALMCVVFALFLALLGAFRSDTKTIQKKEVAVCPK